MDDLALDHNHSQPLAFIELNTVPGLFSDILNKTTTSQIIYVADVLARLAGVMFQRELNTLQSVYSSAMTDGWCFSVGEFFTPKFIDWEASSLQTQFRAAAACSYANIRHLLIAGRPLCMLQQPYYIGHLDANYFE